MYEEIFNFPQFDTFIHTCSVFIKLFEGAVSLSCESEERGKTACNKYEKEIIAGLQMEIK